MVSGLVLSSIAASSVAGGCSPYLCAAAQMSQTGSQRRRARVADAQVGPQAAGFPPPPRRGAHLARQLTVGRHRRAQQRERLSVCPGRHGGLLGWWWCCGLAHAWEVSPRSTKRRKRRKSATFAGAFSVPLVNHLLHPSEPGTAQKKLKRDKRVVPRRAPEDRRADRRKRQRREGG